MQTRVRPRPSWTRRLLVALVAAGSLFTVSAVAGPVAQASVYGSCSISGCSAAASANSTWSSLGYPTSRGWYDWPDGSCDYAGGEYYNREGELPAGDTFYEYDVYPRSCGASRDAYRIVVDFDSGVVWYSPNHYTDFYQL